MMRSFLKRATSILAISATAGIAGCSRETPPADTQTATKFTAKNAPGGAPPADTCVAPPSEKIGIKPLSQHASNWCWAASAEIILDLFGVKAPQCDQVNSLYGLKNCCKTSIPIACDQTGWPDFPKYGFVKTKQTTTTALTWAELTAEIGCQKRPVAFTWQWTGGGGHMMVAYGYQVRAGVNEVLVRDPRPVDIGDDVVMPYSAYVSAANYSHWSDFYNIAR